MSGQGSGGPSQRQPQQPRSAGRSPTDILGEASGKQFLKYIVGVFAAVGVGYGIGLLLFDGVADSGSEFAGAIALLLPIMSAPIISMVTGLITGLRLRTDRKSAAVASGVGALLGFVVLVILLLVFGALIFSGGGSGGDGGGGSDLGDLLAEVLAFGLGVAVTGAMTTYVVKTIEI